MKRLRCNQRGSIDIIILVIVVLALTAGVFLYVKVRQSDRPVVVSIAAATTKPAASQQNPSNSSEQDLSKLPLGDGKIASAPKVGSVFSCQQNFNSRQGGAEGPTPWIHGQTWDAKAKPVVAGSVGWPTARLSIMLNGNSRLISGNGLPDNLATGVFPINSGSQAYQYDRNPNTIQPQSINYSLPANPQFAASPNCVPMGVIGYLTNGIALFNALDAGGRDAVAHEILDRCGGHPQQQGVYHDHGMSDCLAAEDQTNSLVGFALDGFGIFSDRDAGGRQYSSAQLDACHGITSQISWDGKLVIMYHYVLTHDYPYNISCFRGKPVSSR